MKSVNEKLIRNFVVMVILATGLAIMGCSSTADEPGNEEATDPNQVTNIVWQWARLKTTTGYDNDAQRPIQETTTISDPENYTLLLREDGTFSGKADCNEISGTYSTEGGGYIFTLGPSTMAFCGDDSLDSKYLDVLNRVVAGGPDGAGGFALETAAGSERMEFSNGGAAAREAVQAADPAPQVILLDGESMNGIDATAVVTFKELQRELAREGRELWLARMKNEVLQVMQRADLSASIPAEHIFFNVQTGVDAYLASWGQPSADK